MKRYKPLFPLQNITESLRLSDLKKNVGMSDLTKGFANRRKSLVNSVVKDGKKKYSPTGTDKLIECEIDETANHITFIWLTEVTPDVELYGKDYEYGEVSIEGSKSLTRNKSKTYELKIRIMDFFSWLDTYPDKTEITRKDMKDILDVSDIKLSSNDPSFQFQGINYKLTQFDASIYPENRPDKVWGKRHNDDNLLTKHLNSILANIEFWKNPMSNMLTKKLKQRGLL